MSNLMHNDKCRTELTDIFYFNQIEVQYLGDEDEQQSCQYEL